MIWLDTTVKHPCGQRQDIVKRKYSNTSNKELKSLRGKEFSQMDFKMNK